MMYLNWSLTAGPIVFKWWHTESLLEIMLSCIVVFAISASRHAMFKPVTLVMSTCIYGLKSLISVFNMLALMSFNGYIIMFIILGEMAGYYVCSRFENEDVMDCH